MEIDFSVVDQISRGAVELNLIESTEKIAPGQNSGTCQGLPHCN